MSRRARFVTGAQTAEGNWGSRRRSWPSSQPKDMTGRRVAIHAKYTTLCSDCGHWVRPRQKAWYWPETGAIAHDTGPACSSFASEPQ